MPRPERPITTEVKCIADVAQGLRSLRHQRGYTLGELSAAAHYSISALSSATSGKQLPSRELTLAFVRACGGDETEWQARWQAAASALYAVGGHDRAETGAVRQVVRVVSMEENTADEKVLLADTAAESDRKEPCAPSRRRRLAAAALVVAIAILGGLLAAFNGPVGVGAQPAGFAPASVPSAVPSASALVTVLETVSVAAGAPLYIGGAENGAVIPFGTTVQVVCVVEHDALFNGLYLLASPTKWLGFLAPGDDFSNPASPSTGAAPGGTDPRVPTCPPPTRM